MKLTRYSPASLTRVPNFDDWLRHPLAGLPALGPMFDSFFGEPNTNRLATDIFEDTEHYYARFEIPGVKKEDVKVELNDRLLTVTVEKQEKSNNQEQSCSLTRSVSVPDSVAADRISAKLEDGLLTVILPKQEQRKPRTININ
jgi:HSP20 family protein